mgnify:CR=1 FL=1
MEKVIKKAIEGGMGGIPPETEVLYQKEGEIIVMKKGNNEVAISLYAILLDPIFWESLSKNLGYITGRSFNIYARHLPQWQGFMHDFIDHIVAKKDIDSFFNELLK